MPIPTLPIEVIDIILAYFIEHSPKSIRDPLNSVNQCYLEHSLIAELLSFRLIDKSWAIAVLPFVYQGLRVSSEFMINNLSRTIKNSFVISSRPGLSRLSFECLTSPILHISSYQIGNLANQSDDPGVSSQDWRPDYSSTLMHDIEQIITMCSTTLMEARFKFNASVGFSPGIINAVKHVKGLKVLNIVGSLCGVPINDSESIRDLLSVIPGLRSLYLQISFLRRLNLAPRSLRHLEHLSVTCNPNNLDALIHFIETQGGTISSFEYLPHDDRDHAMILAMRACLQILFTNNIPDCLPVSICGVDFPRLRLIRTLDSTSKRPNLEWLESCVFRHMEVFITGYDSSNEYWRQMLRSRNGSSLLTPPRFKHIIFIVDDDASVDDRALAQMFEVYGICCHYRVQLLYSELLSLLDGDRGHNPGCDSLGYGTRP